MLQLHKNNVIVNNEFTYPKFMNQNDRDFQKVLQALTSFDKKLSNLEIVVDKLAKATTDYATSQQQLNKDQSSLNKDLFDELATIQRKLCQISELKSHFLQRYEDILDDQHNLETQLCVFQHEMLHSFELVFRYYKTKKKGFK